MRSRMHRWRKHHSSRCPRLSAAEFRAPMGRTLGRDPYGHGSRALGRERDQREATVAGVFTHTYAGSGSSSRDRPHRCCHRESRGGEGTTLHWVLRCRRTGAGAGSPPSLVVPDERGTNPRSRMGTPNSAFKASLSRSCGHRVLPVRQLRMCWAVTLPDLPVNCSTWAFRRCASSDCFNPAAAM